MNFSKSKVLLKKINALHDSAEGALSTLEKDLLLQYIRDLYECALGTDESATDQPAQHKLPVKKVTAPVAEPIIAASTTMIDEAVVAAVPPSTSVYHEESPQEEVPPTEIPVPSGGEREIDPEMESLFAIKQSSDLSTRLANAPVSDINRAIGINERILTINELFGGDQQTFNQVISDLNEMASFDHAKEYLIDGIATKHNWSSDKKRKKAEVFIKLVSRRYQS